MYIISSLIYNFSTDFKILMNIYFFFYYFNYIILKVFKDVKLNIWYKCFLIFVENFYPYLYNPIAFKILYYIIEFKNKIYHEFRYANKAYFKKRRRMKHYYKFYLISYLRFFVFFAFFFYL